MSATIPHLLSAGHEVIGIDSCEKWGVQSRSTEHRFVQGDCADPTFLRPLLKGVEGVIQAAATLFGVIGFHRRGAQILSRDVLAHQNVLGLSASMGIGRVVYISSSMVYERCLTEPCGEQDADDAQIPFTEYGLSKVVGERLSRSYLRDCGLPFTIWRPFNVIDPGEEGSDDPGVSHVFADLVHRIVVRQQNPLEIIGDGEQVRSFVHLREVGRALADFSFDPRTLNGIYNVGRNEVVSVKQLAGLIYDKACSQGMIRTPRPLEFRSLPAPATDVKRRFGSFEKVENELGWKSATTLDEALDDCFASFNARSDKDDAIYSNRMREERQVSPTSLRVAAVASRTPGNMQ